jgi:hypothetical protein
MPGSIYQIISGITLLTVITIAYGGTFVLSVTRGKVPAKRPSEKLLPGRTCARRRTGHPRSARFDLRASQPRAGTVSRDHARHLGCGGPDAHRLLRIGDWHQPEPAKPRDRAAVGRRRRPDRRPHRGWRGTDRHRFPILNDRPVASPAGLRQDICRCVNLVDGIWLDCNSYLG